MFTSPGATRVSIYLDLSPAPRIWMGKFMTKKSQDFKVVTAMRKVTDLVSQLSTMMWDFNLITSLLPAGLGQIVIGEDAIQNLAQIKERLEEETEKRRNGMRIRLRY